MAMEVSVPMVDRDLDKKDDEPLPEKVNLTSRENPRKLRLRVQLTDVLQATSINGLSQAFNKKKVKWRVFWSVVFFMCLIAFAINFYNIAVHFAKRPILTQLERDEQPFTWPHFTFCSPANPIPFWNSTTFWDKWNFQYVKAHKYRKKLPTYQPNNLRRKIWEHYISLSSIHFADFFTTLPLTTIHSVHVAIERSTIASYSSPLDQFSRVKNFHKLFDTRLETIRSPIPCFTLKPEKLENVIKLSQNKTKLIAIKLYILMDVRSYMKFDMGFESRKMYFYVTNPNATLMSKFPYYVLPGTDSTFQMMQKIHKKVTDCRKENFYIELYDANMVDTRKFHGDFDDCRTSLSQEKFVKVCGCYNPFLPIYKYPNQQPVLCTNMTLFDVDNMTENINCMNKVLKSSMETFNKELNAKCGIYKTTPCLVSSYFVTRYTNTWQSVINDNRRGGLLNNTRHLGNAPENVTEEFIRENLAIMTLAWGRESTKATFEEFEYPVSQFVSDFGGVVGLWIGLSVMSIFEFIEIIYKLVRYLREPK